MEPTTSPAPWSPTTSTFPLLHLPTEIRLAIFAIFLQTDASNKKSLLSVCRQVHHEAFPDFCLHHVFRIPTFCKPFDFANDFLRTLDSHKLSAIRHIQLDVQSRRTGIGRSVSSVERPLRDFVTVFKTYPELRNLETLAVTLQLAPVVVCRHRFSYLVNDFRDEPTENKKQVEMLAKNIRRIHDLVGKRDRALVVSSTYRAHGVDRITSWRVHRTVCAMIEKGAMQSVWDHRMERDAVGKFWAQLSQGRPVRNRRRL